MHVEPNGEAIDVLLIPFARGDDFIFVKELVSSVLESLPCF